MEGTVRKPVVVSAVNIRKGGTLTVLRECLGYLSGRDDLQVTAIVHDRRLCDFPGIGYIEIPWSAKGWGRRLWCEYHTLGKISRRMSQEPYLWFSLHDTTPNVRARHRAVYCHTSFPFLKTIPRDWKMDPKIPLFAHLTKYAYRINVRRNDWLVVQQDWFRDGISSLTGVSADRIIVAPPQFKPFPIPSGSVVESGVPVFFYPSTPDCHKNFETLCEAARILETEVGPGRFKVLLTVRGDENRYAAWLLSKWGGVGSVKFAGFLSREDLGRAYAEAACLVFPSRVETWGLPISEFKATGKPMLLADLPYSHETAAGSLRTAFFKATDPRELASLMKSVMDGGFKPSPVDAAACRAGLPYAGGWEQLFDILLYENPSVR